MSSNLLKAVLLSGLMSLMSGCELHFVAFPKHPASCAFGGATPEQDLVCAARNFGDAGVLYAAQKHAQRGARDCKGFVENVARLLPQYRVEALYTKPGDDETGHVSALVHTADGDYVVDNGALGYPGGVAGLTELAHWFGDGYTVVALGELREHPAASPVAEFAQLAR